MLARAHTFTIEGLQTRHVTVEVDIRPGLPAFTIVGLADASVREARDRVHAAILNSGYEFPGRRITANLAPADVPKVGPGLDLALACAILAASGQLAREGLAELALVGELGLDGRVKPCPGALAVAQATAAAGMRRLVLAPGMALEATLVQELEVAAAERLSSAVRILAGGAGDRWERRGGAAAARLCGPGTPDLSEIRGQGQAVEAMIVAAAGGHNSLLVGPPGTGKTMLAQRLPSILPPLSRAEAIEVTRIQSMTGRRAEGGLVRERPFRAPHHTITTAGMVGGARSGWVGEIVLAHLGVLMLDELSEFSRQTLEALRQPLEDGRVAVVRARHSAVYPARFMLVATSNPCPCGYAGEIERCRCSEADLARHRRRLSGPLLDRMDLICHMERSGTEPGAQPYSDSAKARGRVLQAREIQARRLLGEGVALNSHMDARMAAIHAKLSERAELVLTDVHRAGLVSARGAQRLLRVARTIADLEGRERIETDHMRQAVALRLEGWTGQSRAA